MRVVLYFLTLHLAEDDNGELAVSVNVLPFLGPSQVHLLELVEEHAAEVVKELVFEADLHEPLLVLQVALQLIFQFYNLRFALDFLEK